MRGFGKVFVTIVITTAVLLGGFFLYLNKFCSCESSVITEETKATQKFIIYGDTRTDHETHQKVIDKITEGEYAAVFHTGDLVNDGSSQDDWNNFFKIERDFIESNNFYSALGNHEGNDSNYYQYFDLPNNERWYSVDFDTIHFIVLDSNASLGSGSEQVEWLENDLLSIKKEIKYIITVLHHPLYSSGSHGTDEMGFNSSLEPFLVKYGVDAVFSGHDHDYERSKKSGIYYIVSGGGGAPLYSSVNTNIYSEKFLKEYHFCVMENMGDSLQVIVYGIEGDELDSFEIK